MTLPVTQAVCDGDTGASGKDLTIPTAWLFRARAKTFAPCRVINTSRSRSLVIPGRAKHEPGIHNHHREYGFRARAPDARPGMTRNVVSVARRVPPMPDLADLLPGFRSE